MFKKVEESIHMLRRDMEDILMTPTEPLEMQKINV